MPTQLPHRVFKAEDHRDYAAWLQRTIAAYGILVLFGMGLIAVQATTESENIATYMADAISQAAP
jgi:hypothetical protein